MGPGAILEQRIEDAVARPLLINWRSFLWIASAENSRIPTVRVFKLDLGRGILSACDAGR